jgi:putative heme-binding domain-containing protein
MRYPKWFVRVALLAASAYAPPLVAAQDDVEAGASLFTTSCKVCHGEAGVGNRAPALRGDRLTTEYVTNVILQGKPGTMMPKFAGAFDPKQVQQLVRYVMSLQRPDSVWSTLRGTAASGELVFFDVAEPYSCQSCHAVGSRGRRVGPDLMTKLKGKSPREIFQKIVIVPHRSADPAYVTVRMKMRNGDQLVGIKAEERAGELTFYDTSVLPPAVRTVHASDILSTTRLSGSSMPSDYASRLPLQQLLDLVAFLKSTADGSPAVVGFDDVIREPARTRRER